MVTVGFKQEASLLDIYIYLSVIFYSPNHICRLLVPQWPGSKSDLLILFAFCRFLYKEDALSVERRRNRSRLKLHVLRYMDLMKTLDGRKHCISILECGRSHR